MKRKELPKVEPVHIKPLFGLKPGLWLTILYAMILVLAIFFICFLPGIVKGGKRVSFYSNANNAAVYLDGDYIGGTPFTRFIPSGEYSVEFKVNGISLDYKNIKVSHPVFMTWMFPRKMTVSSDKTLNRKAFDAVVSEFFTDLGAYSAIMEYDDTFRYAPLFTEFVKTVSESEFKPQLTEILTNASFFITTEEMKDDFANACSLAGLSISVPSLEETSFSTREKADYNDKLKFSETWLNDIKGFDTGKFSVSQICITESQYAAFVKENPQWNLSEKESLIKQGLVDDYYLAGVNLSTAVSTNKPVRNVSYYAAEAFCKWLTEKTGKTVCMPTESQWISCCISCPNTGMQKSLVPAVISNFPSAMLGGVWELTSSDYIPHISEKDAAYNFILSTGASLESIIKGGSYISKTEINALDVGTAPKNLCSDYMGFRIIWY